LGHYHSLLRRRGLCTALMPTSAKQGSVG
jgi:hypothetical protein